MTIAISYFQLNILQNIQNKICLLILGCFWVNLFLLRVNLSFHSKYSFFPPEKLNFNMSWQLEIKCIQNCKNVEKL